MARARTLQHEDYHVVALMGDGAMTGGLAYEAMNDAGESSEQLIVILNDNGMSITPNVGGIAQHLCAHPHAAGLLPHQKGLSRRHGKGARRKVPLPPDAPAQGALEAYALRHVRSLRRWALNIIGPVDGHDLKRLEYMLRLVKDCQRIRSLLHVITQKGKGYAPAEENPRCVPRHRPFRPGKGIEPRCGHLSDIFRHIRRND